MHSWSWKGYEGSPAEVVIYADASYVKLYLNDEFIAQADIVEHKAVIQTVYKPGTLSVVAFDENDDQIGKDELVSCDDTYDLKIDVSKETLQANGQDLSYLDISLCDQNGIIRSCEDADISIEIEGPCTLEGFGSADPFNTQPYTSNVHKTYYGRVQAIIRSTYEEGKIKITARDDSHALEKSVKIGRAHV